MPATGTRLIVAVRSAGWGRALFSTGNATEAPRPFSNPSPGASDRRFSGAVRSPARELPLWPAVRGWPRSLSAGPLDEMLAASEALGEPFSKMRSLGQRRALLETRRRRRFRSCVRRSIRGGGRRKSIRPRPMDNELRACRTSYVERNLRRPRITPKLRCVFRRQGRHRSRARSSRSPDVHHPARAGTIGRGRASAQTFH